jgi:hypothetical protein
MPTVKEIERLIVNAEDEIPQDQVKLAKLCDQKRQAIHVENAEAREAKKAAAQAIKDRDAFNAEIRQEQIQTAAALAVKLAGEVKQYQGTVDTLFKARGAILSLCEEIAESGLALGLDADAGAFRQALDTVTFDRLATLGFSVRSGTVFGQAPEFSSNHIVANWAGSFVNAAKRADRE